MKYDKVIMIEAESYEEEQHLLGQFPDAVFINLSHGHTKFFVHKDERQRVEEAIKNWKEK